MRQGVFIGALLAAATASADLQEKPVTYATSGDTTFKGHLVWDDSHEGERPGVLVVHEWWGLNDYARQRARALAEEGYTALAVDMYGDGKVADHPAEATVFVNESLAGGNDFRARFVAARQLLEREATVDEDRIAAIGYCFGGSTVLSMARQGVDLDLVASFHGALQAAAPAQPGSVKPRIVVFHGGSDPMVPMAQVTAFKQEMETAGADYEVVVYPDAKHSFTVPSADETARRHELDALAYDKAADQDSWQRLLSELDAVFATGN